MTLTTYRKKRDFKHTSEPTGNKSKKRKKSLEFVVQQHAASHLHFDFRLEMEGVLKSWAVPKGPSLNPDDKRLAMMVEDHPYDYKNFEGTIPEGNYGAGNVIVWDRGTYHSAENENGDDDEKQLLKGLKAGNLKFILDGEKLKGEFALIRLKGKSGNEWLLIKKKDKYASTTDVLKKNKSVISGKPLVMRVSKAAQKKAAKAPKRSAVRLSKKKSSGKTAMHALRADPGKLKPMLAETSGKPFSHPDWIFEIKHDGYRALALIDGKGGVELYSRNLLSFNNAFSPVAEKLSKIDTPCLLDGEIVLEDENGRSDFQLLQNYQRKGEGQLKYYVFDLLNLDGFDTTKIPLIERKELLKTLIKKYPSKGIVYSDHIEEDGEEFFREAKAKNLEGMIAKEKHSAYLPGFRSKNWLKIKSTKQQEAVITGITEPRGGRKYFGSLILGLYEDGKFIYAGNCGTGFSHSVLKELYDKFKPHFRDKSPFAEKIKFAAPVQWMKPAIVCEVRFTEWTKDHIMRHPVYLGLRIDKKPTEVVREPIGDEALVIPEDAGKQKRPSKKKTAKKSSSQKTAKRPAKKKQEATILKVGNRQIQLSNQDKIYWPDEKITKGDLVNYYRQIAPVILPYLKNRPQSLHRFPNGIRAKGFFQKDVDPKSIPSWMKTEKIFSESTDEYVNYLVCNDAATLVYMANLGCIEINPWNSTVQKQDMPDWMVIDLDPEKIAFAEVVRTAHAVREVFEMLNIESYCKTSGATGLHIYVPLGAKYDYDSVKMFAELIAGRVHKLVPDITSILRSPSKRQGKVYVDFLQNRRGQTLAAPYSARPKPGATVSTPLEWPEVNAKLNPADFTIHNILRRIEKKGDLWKPVLGKGIDLVKTIRKLESLSE